MFSQTYRSRILLLSWVLHVSWRDQNTPVRWSHKETNKDGFPAPSSLVFRWVATEHQQIDYNTETMMLQIPLALWVSEHRLRR